MAAWWPCSNVSTYTVHQASQVFAANREQLSMKTPDPITVPRPHHCPQTGKLSPKGSGPQLAGSPGLRVYKWVILHSETCHTNISCKTGTFGEKIKPSQWSPAWCDFDVWMFNNGLKVFIQSTWCTQNLCTGKICVIKPEIVTEHHRREETTDS